MDRLTAMEVFVEVAHSGSFSATAVKLDMSRAMVTRYVAELEQWLGARLLQRTTRSVTLTDAGESCLRRSQQSGRHVPGGHQRTGPLAAIGGQSVCDWLRPVLPACTGRCDRQPSPVRFMNTSTFFELTRRYP